MNLSNEDALRLNVLMQQPVEAVRINESKMVLYALLPEKEVSVQLSPTGNDDRYLREVRQLLSGYALGSPEGFPVFLQRWNRMGQIKSEKLSGLLKIAEPEAVLAIVQSPFLTQEIARRAWWCMSSSEIARLLLDHPVVRHSELAKELVDFLLEFMPFEEDALAQIESAKQVVLSQQLSEEQLVSLWQKGKRKAPLRIGFLAGDPQYIPQAATTNQVLHDALFHFSVTTTEHAEFKKGMLSLCEEPAQKFLRGINEVVSKLPNQDATIFFYDVINDYFSWANLLEENPVSWDMLPQSRERLKARLNISTHEDEVLEECIEAVLDLSLLSQSILNPIFSQTDAVGSVMRKKLNPLTESIQQRLELLIDNS